MTLNCATYSGALVTLVTRPAYMNPVTFIPLSRETVSPSVTCHRAMLRNYVSLSVTLNICFTLPEHFKLLRKCSAESNL